MDIIISNSSSKHIFVQISEQIKKYILLDQLKEGELLPSIRVLAKELQISVITIKNAYEELEKEGLIESVPGKGFYVASKNKELLREKKLGLIEEKLADVVEECKTLGISEDELIEIIRLLF